MIKVVLSIFEEDYFIMIKDNYTLSDIISINPNLGFVLHRFGIKLDSEERVLKDACIAQGIDPNFFVDILNLYNDPSSFDPIKMESYDVEIIIDYLKRTHKFYLTKRLNEIEQSIKNLFNIFEDQPDILSYLNLFFLKYRKSLTAHIREEEGTLFPYIKNLFKASEGSYAELIKNNSPLQKFLLSHDDTIEKDLSDLRLFLMKRVQNLRQDTQYRVFLTQLETFEKDLNIHALVEDDILIPIGLKLEKSILENNIVN